MEICPKCNRERKPNGIECPHCGIVYEKYEAYKDKKRMTQESKTLSKDNIKNEIAIDLCSANMTVQGLMAKIELEDGEIRIKNWPNETLIRAEDICGVNFVEPGMLTNGYLHIATFANPTPPNNRLSAGANPQCLVFNNSHASMVQNLFRMIQSYLNDNPPAARHPKGELLAERAMKLDVLPQNTRKVYDEQVGDYDVRFVIMGLKGQAIIALSERLVVVKAGFMACTGGALDQ